MEDQIQKVVEEVMAGGQVSGMALAVAREDRPVEYLFIGDDADGQKIELHSLFPVASVTKLATALTVLRLAEDEALDVDEPLAYHLPDAQAAQPDVTLRKLLCHSSGLPADVDPTMAPYAPGLDWPTLAQACLRTPLEAPPDTRVEYSNTGYGLLALVVERATGKSFASALDELVLRPLGVEGYLGVEPPRPPVLLAGVRGTHAATDLEPYNSAFWRSLALPWSGLLTTVDGALGLLRAFQGRPATFLRAATVAEATRKQTGDLGCKIPGMRPWPHCHWGLGPDLRDRKDPHWAPAEASPESFGHAGQSGCLVWADPPRRVAWAHLGARTADNGWLLKRGPAIGAAILSTGDG